MPSACCVSGFSYFSCFHKNVSVAPHSNRHFRSIERKDVHWFFRPSVDTVEATVLLPPHLRCCYVCYWCCSAVCFSNRIDHPQYYANASDARDVASCTCAFGEGGNAAVRQSLSFWWNMRLTGFWVGTECERNWIFGEFKFMCLVFWAMIWTVVVFYDELDLVLGKPWS